MNLCNGKVEKLRFIKRIKLCQSYTFVLTLNGNNVCGLRTCQVVKIKLKKNCLPYIIRSLSNMFLKTKYLQLQ